MHTLFGNGESHFLHCRIVRKSWNKFFRLARLVCVPPTESKDMTGSAFSGLMVTPRVICYVMGFWKGRFVVGQRKSDMIGFMVGNG